MDAFSPRGAAAQAGQVGLRSRFVQKNQSGRIKAELAPPPRPTRRVGLASRGFCTARCRILR